MKFGIVCQKTSKVFKIYESDEPKDSTKFWDYKWTSTEGHCEHIQLHNDLDESSIEELNAELNNLESKMVKIQIGISRVPTGEMEEARDDEGVIILNENNNPTMVPSYIDQPTLQDVKRIVRK